MSRYGTEVHVHRIQSCHWMSIGDVVRDLFDVGSLTFWNRLLESQGEIRLAARRSSCVVWFFGRSCPFDCAELFPRGSCAWARAAPSGVLAASYITEQPPLASSQMLSFYCPLAAMLGTFLENIIIDRLSPALMAASARAAQSPSSAPRSSATSPTATLAASTAPLSRCCGFCCYSSLSSFSSPSLKPPTNTPRAAASASALAAAAAAA